MIYKFLLMLMSKQSTIKFDTTNKKIFIISYKHEEIQQCLVNNFKTSLIYLEKNAYQDKEEYFIKKIKIKKSKNFEEYLEIFCDAMFLRLKTILLKEKLLIKFINQKLEEWSLKWMIKNKIHASKEFIAKISNNIYNETSSRIAKPQTKNNLINWLIETSSDIVCNILVSDNQNFVKICNLVYKNAQLIFLQTNFETSATKNDIFYLYNNEDIIFYEADLHILQSFYDLLNLIKSGKRKKEMIYSFYITINFENYLLKCFKYLFENGKLTDLEFRKKLSDDIRQIIKIKEIYDDIVKFLNIDKSIINLKICIDYDQNIIRNDLQNVFEGQVKKNDINFLKIEYFYNLFLELIGFMNGDISDVVCFVGIFNFLADKIIQNERESINNENFFLNKSSNLCKNINEYLFNRNYIAKFSCFNINEEGSETED